MTKKHFIMIAKLLREGQEGNRAELDAGVISQDEFNAVDYRLTDLVENFEQALRQVNGQFDTNRFLTACTPDYIKQT